MSTPNRTTDRRHRRTHLLALAGLGSLVAAVLPAALAAGTATASDEAGCRLVELAHPAGSPWGTVIDIEVVNGQPTYFGTVDRRRKDGELHPQSVVWRGLEGKPVRVGPRGTDGTVALGLTSNGVVNGWSEDWEKESMRFWVQDLATGELRWFRTKLEGRRTEAAYVRSVNRRGAATGWIHSRGDEHEWAVGYRPGSSKPFRLPVPRRAEGSSSHGMNDRGQRAGFWSETTPETAPFGVFHATVWDADGTRHTLESPGYDAEASWINATGQVAGGTWIGPIDGGHYEGAFWASYGDPVALGLLPDGGESSVFGLDEGGRVVGFADHLGDSDDPMADPNTGTTWHNVLWTEELGEGTLRVLPSLYSVAEGEDDWTQWHSTHAAHATIATLDQVGAGTHAGFADDGTPIGAPTVFVNASQCGVEVETSHEAFWDDEPTTPVEREVPTSRRDVMGGSDLTLH